MTGAVKCEYVAIIHYNTKLSCDNRLGRRVYAQKNDAIADEDPMHEVSTQDRPRGLDHQRIQTFAYQ